MGALHQGHASLIRRALGECPRVVVSIFVNPLQFGPGEDLSRYPRAVEEDLALCQALGVEAVFTPSPEEFYPPGFATRVVPEGCALPLEGERRPGHFSGVATVLVRLFGMLQPARAYFGEKDFQQLQVVRQLVRDLNLPVTVVGCPIVRDQGGLALSSRNRYLSPEQRERARVLYQALQAAQQAFSAGERLASALRARMLEVLTIPEAQVDYAVVVDTELREVPQATRGTHLLVAATLFGIRLIDHLELL
jgi:pantoate--beta-alanine ligase